VFDNWTWWEIACAIFFGIFCLFIACFFGALLEGELEQRRQQREKRRQEEERLLLDKKYGRDKSQY